MIKRFCLILILFISGLSCREITAAPTVSNRLASIEEVGYLPSDSIPSLVNPPALAWLNEKGALSWNLQVSEDPDFNSLAVKVGNWPYLLYTHTESFKPGRYYWRYQFTNKTGETSNWSVVRSFDVSSTAVEFPRPSHDVLKSKLSSGHPRMFMRPETLINLREPETSNPVSMERLVSNADGALSATIMQEPKPWSTGKWDAGEWGEYLRQATAATNNLDTLAFAWLITGKPEYGERAKEHLMEYTTWDPEGPSSMRINDEVGMPMLHSISRAYDWLFPLLNEEDKKQIRTHILGRGEETFKRLRLKPYEQFAYNSHSGRMYHFLGEAGLAFYDEIPDAEKWLNYAMTIFYGWYPLWGDNDGGWAEGLHYWTSYNDRITWWLDLMNQSLDIDGSKKPFYANVADFPLFVCPPGNPVAGFGDFSERPVYRDLSKRVVSAFAQLRQNGKWQWYADALGDGKESGPFAYMRALRKNPDPVKPVGMPLLKVFPQAGYALFHTDMANAANNLHVAMRCSPFGNVSHSHNDQNAIVMSAYGEPLLVNTGLRDFYGSPFCKEYYWQTLSHNSILFDGKGQVRDKNTTGSFVGSGEGNGFAWVAGDATRAYGGLVDNYRRWLIFVPDQGAILIDEVRTTASTATLLFHGRAPFEYRKNAVNPKFSLEKGNTRLKGWITAPSSDKEVQLTQTDQYPVPLGNNKKPIFDEWHLRADLPLSKDRGDTQYIITWLMVEKNGEAKSSGHSSYRVNDKMTLSLDRGTSYKFEVDFSNLSVKRTE